MNKIVVAATLLDQYDYWDQDRLHPIYVDDSTVYKYKVILDLRIWVFGIKQYENKLDDQIKEVLRTY